jgi:hypothetical protein
MLLMARPSFLSSTEMLLMLPQFYCFMKRQFIRTSGGIFFLQMGNKASCVTVFAPVTAASGTGTGASND